MERVIQRQVADFHTDHIFDCGQAFRWQQQRDGSYTGIAEGRIVNIRFIPEGEKSQGGTKADSSCFSDNRTRPAPCRGRIVLSNTSEEEFEGFWKKYLDLDRDYGAIKRELSQKDPVMKEAIRWGGGIRLLRQEKWEALLSFLISQNNHIPRIKGCIEALSENFGEKAGQYQGRWWYSLPSPKTLASMEPEDLSICRLGYRAKYLIGTARQVERDGLPALEQMADPAVSYEEAFEYLTRFCGVGPKVASCVLLFSMEKYKSFPLDVWMKRVMERLYGQKTEKEMKAFAENTFGDYGGFAQQYLFYYIRQTG